ncbi:MAG: hypothetical protein ACTSVV_09120 [Promethearchaeota archaeon]
MNNKNSNRENNGSDKEEFEFSEDSEEFQKGIIPPESNDKKNNKE